MKSSINQVCQVVFSLVLSYEPWKEIKCSIGCLKHGLINCCHHYNYVLSCQFTCNYWGLWHKQAWICLICHQVVHWPGDKTDMLIHWTHVLATADYNSNIIIYINVAYNYVYRPYTDLLLLFGSLLAVAALVSSFNFLQINNILILINSTFQNLLWVV